MIPYQHKVQNVTQHFDENGWVYAETYPDTCPVCEAPIEWARDADEWVITDDGARIPQFVNWCANCAACQNSFASNGDGLVFAVDFDVDDDEIQ